MTSLRIDGAERNPEVRPGQCAFSAFHNVKQPGKAERLAENYSSVLQIGCQIVRVGMASLSTGDRIIRGSTPHRPADRNRMGFRSPPRAALRIRKAICTFIADVLASMGMLCSASTKTRFNSASVSGSKFAPSCSANLSRSVGSIERCYKLAAARRLRACEILLTSKGPDVEPLMFFSQSSPAFNAWKRNALCASAPREMNSKDERQFATPIRALSHVHHDVNSLHLSLLI
jgi:hypothetical protein